VQQGFEVSQEPLDRFIRKPMAVIGQPQSKLLPRHAHERERIVGPLAEDHFVDPQLAHLFGQRSLQWIILEHHDALEERLSVRDPAPSLNLDESGLVARARRRSPDTGAWPIAQRAHPVLTPYTP